MPRIPNYLVGVLNRINVRNLGADAPQDDAREEEHGEEGDKIAGAKFVFECAGRHFLRHATRQGHGPSWDLRSEQANQPGTRFTALCKNYCQAP